MSEIRKGYAFKLLPTLAALLFSGLFVALGLWQLDRAAQKTSILQDYTSRSKAAPVALGMKLPIENADAWRYRRVRMTGRFDDAHQFLLDNQVSRGQAGYRVLTPLRLADSRFNVLVDRGWIALGPSRERLPDVTVEDGQVELTGTVYIPYGRGFSLGAMDAGEDAWPRRVQFLDFERMAELLGYPLAQMTIRLAESAPHGYRREARILPFGPERHLGYAVQWFALAATVAVIYVVLTVRALRR